MCDINNTTYASHIQSEITEKATVTSNINYNLINENIMNRINNYIKSIITYIKETS